MEYNVFKTLRVIVKVLGLICLFLLVCSVQFLLVCSVQLHIQESNLRSGTVCDKQIVDHIFTEKEYVIYISEPSENLARLANPRATARFSVSPEVYSKYQVGDEFDSTTEIW